MPSRSRATWRDRSGVLIVTLMSSIATLVGFGLNPPAASASTASVRASEATNCADRATGPASDNLKMAVCADLISDLAGIGQVLGLPILAPASLAVTNPVEVLFSGDADPESPTAYLDTKYFSNGVTIEPCQVTVFPLGSAFAEPDGSVSPALHVLLAHEAVHCYQNSVISFDESGGNGQTLVPQWISEGVATYVATIYTHGPEPATDQFWANGWLGTPNKELLRRSYDAVGWYSMVARATGNDLTAKIAPAWRAWVSGGEDAFITALGGDEPAVEAAWAPSLLHSPQWGDAWDTPGIGVPIGAQPATVNDTIAAEDVPFTVQIAPYAAVVDSESTVADGLVEVSIDNGLASVHDLGTADALDFKDQLFCIGSACDDSGLTCPGSSKGVKPIPLTVPFLVAAGGSTKLGTLTLENISAPTTPSAPMQLPKGAGPCTFPGTVAFPKAAYSEGEPHLQTLSGGSYDFQGAGEYTLVRSAGGDVDVQVRAAPAENSRSVAWNTAVAMKVVSTVVEVDVGEPAIVRVNGKRITLPTSGARTLAGGGKLAYTSNGVTGDVVVTWPDGSQIDVFADTVAENATFTPPVAGVDTFTGLLAATAALKVGTQATGTTEKLIGGDGHSYVIDPNTPAGFKALYGPFADSWKITPKTSLFTYPRGKTTASFDVKDFPARLITTASLPEAKLKRTKAACRAAGVTDPKLIKDCAVDVGETGKVGLATATVRIQSEIAAPSTTTPTTTTTVGSGSSSGDSPPALAAIHPPSYYFTHPCEVVTLTEINEALGYPYKEYGAQGSECRIATLEENDITFSHESVEQFKSANPGSAGSGPVTSLGHDAYCVVRPASAIVQSYVVTSLGTDGSLQVLADNCAYATALTMDALSHISGT
jgi:hypothetical protein